MNDQIYEVIANWTLQALEVRTHRPELAHIARPQDAEWQITDYHTGAVLLDPWAYSIGDEWEDWCANRRRQRPGEAFDDGIDCDIADGFVVVGLEGRGLTLEEANRVVTLIVQRWIRWERGHRPPVADFEDEEFTADPTIQGGGEWVSLHKEQPTTVGPTEDDFVTALLKM